MGGARSFPRKNFSAACARPARNVPSARRSSRMSSKQFLTRSWISMIARFRGWRLGNASWKRCGRWTRWLTCDSPVSIVVSRKQRSSSTKSKNWRLKPMIQLKADCLIFKTAGGENAPCPAEMVTVELMGEAAGLLDPELIRHASPAVLHYFKHEL